MDDEESNSRTIRLPDGRQLGYAEYGENDGDALLYFHGHPGSRLEAALLAEPANRLGLRLIGVDRPGMGLSDFQAGRRLLDWPRDVVALADHLQLDRFAVVGYSGGGPYALACAYTISSRLTACGIISGVGTMGWGVAFLSLWLPHLLMPRAHVAFRTQEQARVRLMQAAQKWIAADRASLAIASTHDDLAASLVEALRQGTRGAISDAALIAGGHPWGFRPEDLSFPTLLLWHGEQDQEIPLVAGRRMASQIKNIYATFYPDEGHLSVIVTHAEEILTALISSFQREHS